MAISFVTLFPSSALSLFSLNPLNPLPPSSSCNSEEPMWKGRLRVMEYGSEPPTRCLINLEDKDSGELFAQCPYQPTKQNSHGGCEAVLDSSRYFVLTVVDQQSGQKAYVGMGFPERTESFDFNVALQGQFSLPFPSLLTGARADRDCI